jgi:hypothetical protein
MQRFRSIPVPISRPRANRSAPLIDPAGDMALETQPSSASAARLIAVRCTRVSETISNGMQPDNLISLKDDMVAFIAGHGMRRLSAFITEEVPTVIFEEENPDGWKDFVEHAKAAGAPFITMSEVVLEKADVAILLDQLREETFPDASEEIDDAEYLVNHVGKIGYLQLGFAHQGVMFIFEVATDWYDSFQNLMETVSDLGGIVVDNRESDE